MPPSNKNYHDGEIGGAVPVEYQHLVVHRKNDTAYMRTESFVTELKPVSEGKAYRYVFDPLTVGDPAQSCFEELNVEDIAPEELHRSAAGANKKAPPQQFKEVRGRWINGVELSEVKESSPAEENSRDNLFGRNGAFLVSNDADDAVIDKAELRTGKSPGEVASLRIPRIDNPIDEDFAYYGCQLLHHGDLIAFDEHLPLFTSVRTENYAFDYLLASSGIYVETHDIVHVHQPMVESNNSMLETVGQVNASGGYWVLGRAVAPDVYWFSALKIPFGAVAMMPPGVIHNDVYLTGKYRAVYGARSTRPVKVSSVIVCNEFDGAKMHMI